ncbi:TSUP family transporter [Helicobacter cinaedi]|uniref:TSUP family transporter n=1 Tax=Helicobacter cinaedi TaxID=213 RepID=UPI000CF04FA8|nr:TSUP family transporter [Helicobacter cinaedi]
MFEDIGAFWYIVLFVASVFGGFVGSLSGGAGMITMPLLLLSGLNPLQALATNKLQACVGSFTGAAHYYKNGLMDFQQSRIYIVIAIVFSSLGAALVQFVSLEILSKVLPFVMILVGIYFLFSSKTSDEDRARTKYPLLLYASCAVASVYGGLLGVGIGSFVLVIFVGLAGYGLSKALAYSRSIVFSINLSSALLFIAGGNVLWILGILMCVGQMIGASLGAKLALKSGAKVIRPVVICLCFIMSIRLIIKEFF